MSNKTFQTTGALQGSTVVVFQVSEAPNPGQPEPRFVVTSYHPDGKALVQQIITDNIAALEALANETREVRKR